MDDQGTHIELLRTAVRGGASEAVSVAHEVGASAAQTGVPLHEVLDHVERAYAPDPPDHPVTRAAALAWADVSLVHRADVSCEDPLTSMATASYLRLRLAEIYRGADADDRRACDSHVLVVVELPRPGRVNEIELALRALEVAEVLRSVFTGDETIAQLSTRRFVALTTRDRGDDLTLDLLGLLLDRALDDRVQSRLWVERLPSGADGVAPVLAALCE